MSLLAVFMLTAHFAALFDVQTIALHTPSATVFLANANADSTADVFVLEGSTVTAYSTDDRESHPVLALPEGTSAFDVTDLDGDGHREVVAVCGNRIMRCPFAVPGSTETPLCNDLFALRTQLAEPSPQPYPYVLVLHRDDTALLALPCEETFELRDLDGTQVASYPIGPDAPRRVSYSHPFIALSIFPPQIGNDNALEMRVKRDIEFEPDLPSDIFPVKSADFRYRRGTLSQARDAVQLDEDYWPWFPLRHTGSLSKRVLYALPEPGAPNTRIRIRESKSDELDIRDLGATIGPERRYPGALILLEDDLPDFNNDGYVDLLLWKAPQPGLSVNSLTRAINRGLWPLQLTVHLFSPEKKRYEPRPAAQVQCDVPVLWFLTDDAEGPLQHCVLRDFDGDGGTDLGACVAPDRFCVWLYRDTGFAAQPDFDRVFPAPIKSAEFKADLDGSGRTSLGLRTEKAIHFLHAIAPL